MALVWEHIRNFLNYLSLFEAVMAITFFVVLVVIFGLNMSVWALRVTFGLFWGGLVFAAGAFAFSYFGWHINPSFVLYLSVGVTCFFTIVSKVIMPN